MRRVRMVLGSLIILAGCGGSPDSLRPVGFVNHTNHSEAELQKIWAAAQKHLTQQIDLNPLKRQADPDAAAQILPGDPRALNIPPRQVYVASERDVASDMLYWVTGVQRSDPTGLIPCAQPCNVRFAAAYSRYRESVTKYAASWDRQGQNFDLILQYEFENQILFALDYDMKWR